MLFICVEKLFCCMCRETVCFVVCVEKLYVFFYICRETVCFALCIETVCFVVCVHKLYILLYVYRNCMFGCMCRCRVASLSGRGTSSWTLEGHPRRGS